MKYSQKQIWFDSFGLELLTSDQVTSFINLFLLLANKIYVHKVNGSLHVEVNALCINEHNKDFDWIISSLTIHEQYKWD